MTYFKNGIFNGGGNYHQISFGGNAAAILQKALYAFGFQFIFGFVGRIRHKIPVAAADFFTNALQILRYGTHSGAGHSDKENILVLINVHGMV